MHGLPRHHRESRPLDKDFIIPDVPNAFFYAESYFFAPKPASFNFLTEHHSPLICPAIISLYCPRSNEIPPDQSPPGAFRLRRRVPGAAHCPVPAPRGRGRGRLPRCHSRESGNPAPPCKPCATIRAPQPTHVISSEPARLGHPRHCERARQANHVIPSEPGRPTMSFRASPQGESRNLSK